MTASMFPRSFPVDDAVLPDLLVDAPGRARLAYHPRESFDDRGGWATERVFFLGVDGSWRALELLDLRLPESTHPGIDTYGAGDLSPDGTRWAAPTNAGIVLLDLRSGQSQVVALPGHYTSFLGWRPDGERVDVVRLSRASTHGTWSINARSLKTARAPYHLPIDGYAHDGSVVTYTTQGADTLRMAYRDEKRHTSVVPVPFGYVRLGGAEGPKRTLFGLNRELLTVDASSMAPRARLRLRPPDAAGWPRGWLDQDTVYFYEGSRGLLTWNTVTGEVRSLTRVTPATRPDSYWSASVAAELIN